MKVAFLYNLQTSPELEAEAEFDTPATVAAIAGGLARLGHDVTPVEASGPFVEVLGALTRLAPDLVFNTAEGHEGRFRESLYPAALEALGLPFTGSDAHACLLTLDKHLTKAVVSSAGVRVPEGAMVRSLDDLASAPAAVPLLVKPAFEGSSKGITQRSVAETERDLREIARELLDRYPAGLLVERFIPGADVVVPFLEAAPCPGGVLEPAGYRISDEARAKRRYAIYDLALKTTDSDHVEVLVPAPIPEETRSRAMALAARAFRALGIRDLGRIDLRLGDDGEIYFIEANALPSLEPGAAIYVSAARAGLSTVESVLDAVVTSAVRRRRA